ncbi:probable thylakoid lumen protein sll1769 isoform X2 [Solanum tuberosum]|uniref:probable thylakoid lumen protein sll1769 isoform X2 n=1 Tax=Solanum tuberosum TaxID=4113 RepID=UPI000739FA7A|nr:PREDICTED: probable thylakoid lumen protein sll1769 isoform X2 [Solanum tuberosum]
MSGVFTISSLYSPAPSPTHRLQRNCIIPPWNSSFPTTNRSGNVAPLTFTCNFSSNPPPPGENESKNILDAFFLGKALAEAVTERIESTVGEFLSTVGRLQAEQQKQVQDFQEEVLERAKQAKEKAARETMETQGLISNSFEADSSTATAASASGNIASPRTNINSQPAKDSELGISNGD